MQLQKAAAAAAAAGGGWASGQPACMAAAACQRAHRPLHQQAVDHPQRLLVPAAAGPAWAALAHHPGASGRHRRCGSGGGGGEVAGRWRGGCPGCLRALINFSGPGGMHTRARRGQKRLLELALDGRLRVAPNGAAGQLVITLLMLARHADGRSNTVRSPCRAPSGSGGWRAPSPCIAILYVRIRRALFPDYNRRPPDQHRGPAGCSPAVSLPYPAPHPPIVPLDSKELIVPKRP